MMLSHSLQMTAQEFPVFETLALAYIDRGRLLVVLALVRSELAVFKPET